MILYRMKFAPPHPPFKVLCARTYGGVCVCLCVCMYVCVFACRMGRVSKQKSHIKGFFVEGEQRKVYYRATQGQVACAQKTQTLMGFSKVFLKTVRERCPRVCDWLVQNSLIG